KLTPEEAEEHPQRSVITRALGPEASVEVDVRSFRARPGDVYLLCSDGLTTMVGEEELLGLLVAHERLGDAGEALIAAANAAGGKDNITVVLLRLEEVFGEGERPADAHTTLAAAAIAPLASSAAPERASIPISHADADIAVRDGEYVEQQGSVNGKQAQTAVPQRPRRPQQASQPTRGALLRRRLRRARTLLVLLAACGVLAAAAYLAFQSVYFIGANQRGLVTMYNGLPYELPGKIKLYTSDYVSGVSASTLSPAHRQALLDHSLRSEGDAAELMRELELGQLSEG
ncbi:MAG TPA: SpoIIE family protein phosphatase, partial [Solirubrobacteraceae bacterium]|nr:SpoIIE family protein phosphatase [Solirubrobacteraceae bacterium]